MTPFDPETPTGENQFGTVLARMRAKSGISQHSLSTLADLDHSYISRLENGKRLPTRDAVERLANAMVLRSQARVALFSAAGLIEQGPINPDLVLLHELLHDPDIDVHLVTHAYTVISSLVKLVTQEKVVAMKARAA